MGFFDGLASAIAGPVIGGFFQNKANKENRSNEQRDKVNDLSLLVKGAKKAGFNPLTALLATGGRSGHTSTQVAPLASTAVIQNAVQGISDVLTGEDEVRRNTNQANLELARLRVEKARAGEAGELVNRTRVTRQGTNVTSSPAKVGTTAAIPGEDDSMTPTYSDRPRRRPGMWSDGATPVIGIDGGNMQIPAKLAKRLKIEPWDVYMTEDNEAWIGDELGQVVQAPKIPMGVIMTEGGLTKNRTVEERQGLIDRPWAPETFFPAIGHEPQAKVNRERYNRRHNR